jgi:putative Ca2+/H+ antiporter (TMEM165/GDT1 family)/heme oxygenase
MVSLNSLDVELQQQATAHEGVSPFRRAAVWILVAGCFSFCAMAVAAGVWSLSEKASPTHWTFDMMLDKSPSEAFSTSFFMILATELGDETFIIAAVMAMRHPKFTVLGGALAALYFMTVLSAVLGAVLPNFISERTVHSGATMLYLFFGLRLLYIGAKSEEEDKDGEFKEVENNLRESETRAEEGIIRRTLSKCFTAIFFEALILTFLAEWGDRSQIATITLASHENPLGVIAGASIGHTICTGLAVFGGEWLGKRISQRLVAFSGGGLFIIFAIVNLVTLGLADTAVAPLANGKSQEYDYAQSARIRASGLNDGLEGPDLSIIPSRDALRALALPTTSAFMTVHASKHMTTRYVDARTTRKNDANSQNPLRRKDVPPERHSSRKSEPTMGSIFDWSSPRHESNLQLARQAIEDSLDKAPKSDVKTKRKDNVDSQGSLRGKNLPLGSNPSRRSEPTMSSIFDWSSPRHETNLQLAKQAIRDSLDEAPGSDVKTKRKDNVNSQDSLRGKNVPLGSNPSRRSEPTMSNIFDWSSPRHESNLQLARQAIQGSLDKAPESDVKTKRKDNVDSQDSLGDDGDSQSTSLDGLALMLDEGTQKWHSKVEEDMPAFMNGVLSYYQWCAFFTISSRDVFSQLVKSLYFIYSAMEGNFDAIDDPNVKALDHPELRRVSALREDMAYFFGPDWSSDLKMTPATLKYVKRVMKVAEEKPYLLVGHQYIRYAGDVSGGQILSSMARKSMKLEGGFGIRFFEFNKISSRAEFMKNWYARLNKLELSQEQKEEIVAEASIAFELNMEIFKEMQANNQEATAGAMWRLLKTLLRSPVNSPLADNAYYLGNVLGI